MSGIKAGDLVAVVRPRPCCGSIALLGLVYRVSGFYPKAAHCGACGVEYAVCVLDEKDQKGLDIRILRRIPPLWELDETEHKEELPA